MIDINDIDKNSKIIESGSSGNKSICVVIDGEHAGICYIKENGNKKIIEANPSELFDMSEIAKLDSSYPSIIMDAYNNRKALSSNQK